MKPNQHAIARRICFYPAMGVALALFDTAEDANQGKPGEVHKVT